MKGDLNCFELCILCGLYFDFVLSPVLTCIQIQSFGWRFIFLHLSSLPSSDFSGSHVAKKDYRLVLFGARALQSFLFCSVFFHGVCKPCHEPETSGDWTHKYHTALVFITRFLYWTFLYAISLIGIFFRYLFVLTYFDSSRRYTNATTLAAGTQIDRTKMTSLDAIFCRGNKSSSRSPARFCRRKHKNLQLALRAREKTWARLVGKSNLWAMDYPDTQMNNVFCRQKCQ